MMQQGRQQRSRDEAPGSTFRLLLPVLLVVLVSLFVVSPADGFLVPTCPAAPTCSTTTSSKSSIPPPSSSSSSSSSWPYHNSMLVPGSLSSSSASSVLRWSTSPQSPPPSSSPSPPLQQREEEEEEGPGKKTRRKRRSKGAKAKREEEEEELRGHGEGNDNNSAAAPAAVAAEKPRYLPPSGAKSAWEAAYLAALAAERDQAFITDFLEQWKQLQGNKASNSDMGLALLLASVACREALALDYALQQLLGDGTLFKLKAKQRVIFRVALASYKYCTRTPVRAIVSSSVELAKKYGGGKAFGNFCNALLRKLPQDDENMTPPALPAEGEQQLQQTRPLPQSSCDDVAGLSVGTSYPPFLVQLLVQDLGGLEQARRVLEAGNSFPPTMARARLSPGRHDRDETVRAAEAAAVPCTVLPSALSSGTTTTTTDPPLPYPLYTLPRSYVRLLARSRAWYLTNGTPAGLIGRLAQSLITRQRLVEQQGGEEGRVVRVLDMCAAPGGKGLAILDVLSHGGGGKQQQPSTGVEVEVTFNDVSEDKLDLIRENLHKYGLHSKDTHQVRTSLGDGATLVGDPRGYDVVIVDAPCSNTGVLARRPEARWRLKDGKVLEELECTQRALLSSAVRLLSPTNPLAEVWYMTCSILHREDEAMVAEACESLGLEVVEGLSMKVLPGEVPAFDGGYAACLRRRRTTALPEP